ncbi:LLM class flavin-dependent oxidoreductase [Pseudonocardia humida]|uniref:LLM class flavin-dependent oxidoreductase n=1 Tax=Pseudonocardia humida TaxID=2800819 RepID=A0ABT0ZZS0_9PSEU|nr:LLM class flavin-dependent oxidoreductase [Pseudonocardia humida]MCO1656247.1 LLM class flavin-dependent oxidoreductase [Pseudonocardia humida]
MKFHWFAEATYPALPTTYPQRHPSGSVDVPAALVDPHRAGELYRMFIRLMQQADRLGWDGLAVNEHHQTTFAMTPSPNLLAAGLASTTENAALLVIGNSLALYNPPVRVAEELAYLDCLSGGRLIAGFVFGTPMDTAFAYGVPPAELRERFHEARELITRAWTEPEPFAFNGRYNRLRYVNVLPRPVQAPPPIWVPGTGSVETWDLVLDEGYCYGYLSFFGLANARPIVRGFWDRVERRGLEPNPHRMAFTQLVCVADTDAEAERLYGDAVRYFFTRQRAPLHYANPPGYTSRASQREVLERAKGVSTEDRLRATRGELSFWEYDELGFIVAGTPERVRQRLHELAVELRVGQLITCMHMGDLAEDVAAMNNELFGTRVAPFLRELWAEYDDPWTPPVSRQRVAAAAPGIPVDAFPSPRGGDA